MKLRKWLALGLIVVGAGMLLLARIAQMEVVVEFPADGGLPTFTDIETHVTPFAGAIIIVCIISVVAGVVLLLRRPR